MKLLPSILGICFWLLGAINPFSIFDKFNEWLIKELDYEERLFVSKINKKKENFDFEAIIKNILFQSNFFENKLTTRKESYYKYSHVNKLLQLED